MAYDHFIRAGEQLREERFHLSCGFCSLTSFWFEAAGVSVVIDCNGTFLFRTAAGEQVIKARPMNDGRECYMDVTITTTDSELIFRLPEYRWTDHYPHCDGESDRWDASIIGVRDEIIYPLS